MPTFPTIQPAFNRPDRSALALNVAAAVGGALLMNGLIFGLHWNVDPPGTAAPSRFEPPDWLVGAVWTLVLLPLTARARWRMNALADRSPRAHAARGWATVLLVSCLVWPLYSLALGSRTGALWGNALTIVLAADLTRRLWPLSRTAALCVAPMVLWVGFATATLLHLL